MPLRSNSKRAVKWCSSVSRAPKNAPTTATAVAIRAIRRAMQRTRTESLGVSDSGSHLDELP